MTAYRLLAMGRVGVDLYPLQHGVPLEAVQTFEKYLGGSPANVAIAAARHGQRCALVSATGADALGRYVHTELLRLGVDDAFVSTISGGPPTSVTFYEVFAPDRFPLWPYRYPTAPDLLLDPELIPREAIRDADALWITGTGFSQEPSRSAHAAALAARGRKPHTILDLDFRPEGWPSAQAAREQLAPALERVTVVVGSPAECEVAVGERDPHRAASALLERGAELAVVKRGPDGVLGATRDERVEAAAFPVTVLNALGAGDGFGGALVHGLLSGWDLARTIHFANVAGAIVASRLGCSTAMPTTVEVERLLEDVGVLDDLA